MRMNKHDRYLKVWRFLAIAFATLFLLILWAAYTGELKAFVPTNYDKLGHLTLYGGATFLCHRSLYMYRLPFKSLPAFPTIFAVFTIAEEFWQATSPNRSFDLVDLFFSLLGIGLAYWLVEWRLRQLSGREV
jgi:VanZ family protein